MFASFPTLAQYMEDLEDYSFDEIKNTIMEHLSHLAVEFTHYIPDHEITCQSWIRNPFNVDIHDVSNHVPGLQEELVELKNEETMRHMYKNETLSTFWINVKKDKPIVGDEAVKVILPFVTTFLCEQGFSTLTKIKTKKGK